MNTGIDLMRHGETGRRSYRGQNDDPLTAAGWQQLQAAVDGAHWDAVVTSTLCRCEHFAIHLATARALPLRRDPRLMEYHFGRWQGVPIDTLAQRNANALQRFRSDPVNGAPPDAEPFALFRERLVAALNDAVTAFPDQRILVLTHGHAIRLLRCLTETRDYADMTAIDVAHASRHALRWPPSADTHDFTALTP